MSDTWIYDIETYPNIFSLVAANGETREIRVFEISDRVDDSKALRIFLTKLYKSKAEMVGFNNLGFDYPIVHHFLKNKGITCDELYDKAMEIIGSMNDNKFSSNIRDKDILINQIDLYKIHHYDNKAKATSLKLLEFNMRSKTIQDLPFPVGKVLSFPEMDTLLHYNKKDVLETYKFYLYSMEAIQMRRALSKEFNMNCMNYNDTRIGKEYFVKQLEAVMPQSCYKMSEFGRKVNQTKREVIDLSEVIFPYIEFERPEFQAVLNWIRSQKITETKGVFSDIEEHLLGDVAKYSRLTEKKIKLKQVGGLKVNTDERKDLMKRLREEKKQEIQDDEIIDSMLDELHGVPDQNIINELMKDHPLGWVERSVLKSGKPSWHFKWRIAETLSVFVDGVDIVFGLGGIHASVEGVTFESDKDYVILDYDYASMYPNLFIANRVFPEHLSERFCDIYSDVYNMRKIHPKGSVLNATMKLALNGTYGATNDKYSPFYDPKATMQITVNGQLTLCMLTEKLLKFNGLKLIQLNTDGISIICKRSDMEAVQKVVDDYDKITGLTMEREMYSKMAIRDVNNYIAVYTNGKYKRNGQYEYKIGHIDGEGLEFHQNQSAVVIRKAAFEKIVNNIPVDKTIKSCKNEFDFCLRTKVNRSSKLISLNSTGDEKVEQNICRYYISDKGLSLIKQMPPLEEGGDWRSFNVESGKLVRTCNDISEFDWNIDYDYYIDEANKLVSGVGNLYKVN